MSFVYVCVCIKKTLLVFICLHGKALFIYLIATFSFLIDFNVNMCLI